MDMRTPVQAAVHNQSHLSAGARTSLIFLASQNFAMLQSKLEL